MFCSLTLPQHHPGPTVYLRPGRLLVSHLTKPSETESTPSQSHAAVTMRDRGTEAVGKAGWDLSKSGWLQREGTAQMRVATEGW